MEQLETWRSIPGFVGYEVSSGGQFRSFFNNAGRIVQIPKLIKQIKTDRGYFRVGLRKNKKQRLLFSHRVVALVFLGPIPSGKQVNHKNGIKSDNSPANLEYVTQSENNKHAYLMGLRSARGNASPVRKIGETEAIKIKYSECGTIKQIARKYGISSAQVCNIKSGKSWSHV